MKKSNISYSFSKANLKKQISITQIKSICMKFTSKKFFFYLIIEKISKIILKMNLMQFMLQISNHFFQTSLSNSTLMVRQLTRTQTEEVNMKSIVKQTQKLGKCFHRQIWDINYLQKKKNILQQGQLVQEVDLKLICHFR